MNPGREGVTPLAQGTCAWLIPKSAPLNLRVSWLRPSVAPTVAGGAVWSEHVDFKLGDERWSHPHWGLGTLSLRDPDARREGGEG